jgi:hypothetical protein
MSGRCKSCNAVLTEDEICAKWSGSDDYCELCSYCLKQTDPDIEIDTVILGDVNDTEDENI